MFDSKSIFMEFAKEDEECDLKNIDDVLDTASIMEDDAVELFRESLSDILDEDELDRLDFDFNIFDEEENGQKILSIQLNLTKFSDDECDTEGERIFTVNEPQRFIVESVDDVYLVIDQEVEKFNNQIIHVFSASEEEWFSF